jgi:hypothetical protein
VVRTQFPNSSRRPGATIMSSLMALPLVGVTNGSCITAMEEQSSFVESCDSAAVATGGEVRSGVKT